MLTKFKPTWTLETIYELTPDEVRRHGIELILTDLDNTLIAWNNPQGTPELYQWLNLMHNNHIPVVVVSNNKKERIQKVVAHLNLPFIHRAMKPSRRGIREALTQFNINPKHVVLVGDQLMTDVLAANRSGILSILVKPLVKSDAWNTKINRLIESQIRKMLVKKQIITGKWGHSLDE